MAITRLQLRGISRTPSDRMTSDGGCAESLNVHIDQQEVAPTLAPQDITSTKLASGSYDVHYIHKGNGYTNYICSKFEDDALSVFAYDKNKNRLSITAFDGSVESVSSIGNTIVIKAEIDGQPSIYYALYQDGKYIGLGSNIPEPKYSFSVTRTELGAKTSALWDYDPVSVEQLFSLKDDPSTATWFENAKNAYWGTVNTWRQANRSSSILLAPVLVRIAVRLYDGSYIYQSSPILCFCNSSDYANRFAKSLLEEHTYIASKKFRIQLGDSLDKVYGYSIKATLNNWNAYQWKDIIAGIDIFVSEEIWNPLINVDTLSGYTLISEGDATRTFEVTLGDTKITDEEKMKEQLLSKSSFYRIADYDIDQLFDSTGTHKSNTLWSGVTLDVLDNDELVLRPELPDGFNSGNSIVPVGEMLSYNSRIVFGGFAESLYMGLPDVSAHNGFEVLQYDTMHYIFFVKEDGQTYTTYRKVSGKYQEHFVSYPNPNCYKVIMLCYNTVGAGVWSKADVPMKAHPSLQCAYAFAGIPGLFNFNAISDSEASSIIAQYGISNPPVVYRSNQLAQSDSSNPFVFPALGRRAFSGRIIGVATTTVALSQNQYDTADIYAFCEDGIFAVSINNDGSIGAGRALSRDIAIKGTICPIDKAIVFTTDKGVMLLEGGSVQCISPNMNGKHYVIENSVKTALQNIDVYAPFINTLEDADPFMAFMKSAKCVYDYTGKRLIFYKTNEEYQYEYNLESATWHKEAYLTNWRFSNALNSYPDAYVIMKPKSGASTLVSTTIAIATSTTYDKDSKVEAFAEAAAPLTTLPSSTIKARFNSGSATFTAAEMVSHASLKTLAQSSLVLHERTLQLSCFTDVSEARFQVFCDKACAYTYSEFEERPYTSSEFKELLEYDTYFYVGYSIPTDKVNNYIDAIKTYLMGYSWTITNVSFLDDDAKEMFLEDCSESCTLSASEIETRLANGTPFQNYEFIDEALFRTDLAVACSSAPVWTKTEDSHTLSHYLDDTTTAKNPTVTDNTTSLSGTKLYSFSTPLDVTRTDDCYGVIVTRPFDLGAPDVHKTIKDIRIRGQYTKSNVKYILLGSQDGFNWHKLASLRGKSWKLFRMVIVTKLKPTERISWVDIDFETRFDNKLR